MSANRSCLVCSQRYYYCNHCNKNGVVDTWRNTYCSAACREIFNTCSNYEGGLISQEDAYNKLIELNINTDIMQKSVKGSVDKIMSYKPKKVEDTPMGEPISIKPRRRRTKNIEE